MPGSGRLRHHGGLRVHDVLSGGGAASHDVPHHDVLSRTASQRDVQPQRARENRHLHRQQPLIGANARPHKKMVRGGSRRGEVHHRGEARESRRPSLSPANLVMFIPLISPIIIILSEF